MILLAIILILINNIYYIYPHSNLYYPQPRGNKRWWGFCSRGLGCYGACESSKDKAPILSIYHQPKRIQRGEKLTIKWKRLNHPGGFIRLALVPFDDSDDPIKFDDNVIKYTCFESNCRESKNDPMLGKNNGPGSTDCSTELVIPDHIPDGKVTLQWTWFGGGVYYADRQAGFSNYVSCSDMILEGGQPLRNLKTPIYPLFEANDMGSGIKGQCRYWSSNDPYQCVFGAENKTESKEGCGYKGQQYGLPNQIVTGKASYYPLKHINGFDPNSEPIDSPYSISGEGTKLNTSFENNHNSESGEYSFKSYNEVHGIKTNSISSITYNTFTKNYKEIYNTINSNFNTISNIPSSYPSVMANQIEIETSSTLSNQFNIDSTSTIDQNKITQPTPTVYKY